MEEVRPNERRMRDMLEEMKRKTNERYALEALESVGINWLLSRLAVAKSYGKNTDLKKPLSKNGFNYDLSCLFLGFENKSIASLR